MQGHCVDINRDCPTWAANGLCSMMKPQCCSSCGNTAAMGGVHPACYRPASEYCQRKAAGYTGGGCYNANDRHTPLHAALCCHATAGHAGHGTAKLTQAQMRLPNNAGGM